MVKKLKRVVIKEELVALTGDFIKATLLNQFLYWAERIKDFDKFIEQENTRAEKHGYNATDLTNGWIYKTAEELSEETMLNMTPKSIRTHLKALVEAGYILERSNPKYKWDRTKQYRVDILKIQKDLLELGYPLEGYKFSERIVNFTNGTEESKNENVKNTNQNDNNYNAIPEITSETTTKTTSKDKDILSEDQAVENEKTLDWETKFETFYKAYPKKVKKKDVSDWFKKKKPNDELFKLMMKKVEEFKMSKQWTDDNGKYIPYPTTWLRGEGWNDEIEVKNTNNNGIVLDSQGRKFCMTEQEDILPF